MIRSNFTPIDYLKIDIANNFGLDKENWDKRIDWFNQNEPDLENLVSKADSPCEFYAGILAYRKYQQSKPTGYMVGLDCTCSVLQWLSILTGDEDTAKLCNVINTGKREDAYTSIYKKLLEKFPELKDKGIGRSEVKKSIMTSYYCSEAKPKELLGEKAALLLGSLLYEMTPRAIELKDFLKNAWDDQALSYHWVMPDNFHVDCLVESPVEDEVTFMCQTVKVTHWENLPKAKGRFLPPNLVHSVDAMAARELVTRCMLSNEKREELNKIFFSKQNNLNMTTFYKDSNTKLLNLLLKHAERSGFLSTRIFDCLDSNSVKLLHIKGYFDRAKELYISLPKSKFYIETIHDCFKCHPNHMDELRQQWINILYEICNSDLLYYLLSQMLPTYDFSDLKGISKSLAPKVKETEYAIC